MEKKDKKPKRPEKKAPDSKREDVPATGRSGGESARTAGGMLTDRTAAKSILKSARGDQESYRVGTPGAVLRHLRNSD